MEEVKKISTDEFQNLKTQSFFKGRIVSPSMSPVVKVGDFITVDVGEMNIKRFDIIVVYLNEVLVCHYLWRFNQKIKPIYMQTRSLSGALDSPIPVENYLGKVVSHELSFLRKIILFLK